MDILIVDDSSYIRAFVRIHLQEAGYEVGEVAPESLYDVLAAIHASRPALVITDYEMPACNGESLLRALREDPALRDLPVIVLSAHREAELVARLSRWNLAAYVLKPIRPEDLVEKVRKFFASAKARQGSGPGTSG
ncbi:response regulator [Geothrix rubra]|uniref:response regulator n=1 Tax=Geothrix rubra TaxID=2927977 RepID=UPI00286966C9|nr:response regulator [Geothrix rubra]